MEKETSSRMKLRFAILLALFVVPAFASEACAGPLHYVQKNLSFEIFDQRFGLVEHYDHPVTGPFGTGETWTNLYFGPLLFYNVPFSATQGLVGCCVILAVLITLPAVLTLRWRKKRTVT
jgi:hypothetical protein